MNAIPSSASVLICGGGFAGALLAIRLLDGASGPLSIIVAEPRASVGRGVAYSTTEEVHLVNGPASHFSLYPEDPLHLARWLTARGHGGDVAESFIPRRLFGTYVEEQLARAIRESRASFRHLRAEVLALRRQPGGIAARLSSGQWVHAAQAVLATGVHPLGGIAAEGVVHPWDAAALDRLADAQDVLIVGASLSMVDAVASLEARGFRGQIHAISRRGHLIEPRRVVPEIARFMPDPLPSTARGLLAAVRAEHRRILAEGGDWQALPPALRGDVLPLWQGASAAERRRFNRHLRSLWDVMAHRAAPPSFAAIDRARAEGRFTARAARLIAAEPGAAILRLRRGGEVRLPVDGIVDCRGHQEHDWRRIDTPLVRDLIGQGMAVPHPSGFGIRAKGLAVTGIDGTAPGDLFALGHPMRGEAWESSSIPEQVAQGGALAALLLEHIPQPAL